jgi:hypothetical protein
MSVIYRKGAYYPGTTRNGTTTTSTQRTSAFNSTTSIVRIAVQNDTYIQPGTTTSTTATTGSMIIPGGGIEFLAVPESSYLAYLQVSTGGWISITELANQYNTDPSLPAV